MYFELLREVNLHKSASDNDRIHGVVLTSKIIVIAISVGLIVLLPSVMGAAQEERVSPRNPFLCGVASFIIPGLGQLLNNEPNKALNHFLIAIAIPVVGYYAALASPTPGLVIGATAVAQLGWAFYSAMDAYHVAQRFNEEHGFASLYLYLYAYDTVSLPYEIKISS